MKLYDSATPYIAAHVLLKKDGKVAFVLRQNTGWGDGLYGLIAGKVDQDESYLAAAVRECKEEAGVDVKPSDMKHVLTAYRKSDTLWVDVLFEATRWQGEPRNAEPHKHAELAWLDPADLPDNVVPSILFYFEQIAAGKTYAEYGWEETS
ncbi:MAG: NUDIX hydrolase [Candidatus Saccharimonadales bacterium]